MGNYDFHTINDKDFEELSLDLLNAEFALGLQRFKPGKDKGIDLRFSTKDNPNHLVVQAKHYRGSGFAQLKWVLSHKELAKIEKLKPDRYIITTSLQLSPQEKDDLVKILSPYLATANDIFSQDDLNDLLSKHATIEKKHFKLWFSGTNVLQNMLDRAVEGRSRHLLERMEERINFYVVTSRLGEAISILDSEKVLLILGQPGVGKTTLAEVILLEKARQGNAVHCVETIREAESVFAIDNTPQVFYFDDFLGSNYLELVSPNRQESEIVRFVDRVRTSPNKWLVLTSRTVIVGHALQKLDKFRRSMLGDKPFELKVEDYDDYEKAAILYNHLYFRNVSSAHRKGVVNNTFYKQIINHQNYSPRIVDFISEPRRIANLSARDYATFVLSHLDEPAEIWRHSFENQIGYFERCLLFTLFSFDSSVPERKLIEAFQARLTYEKQVNNHTTTADQFNECIAVLLGGFVHAELYDSDLFTENEKGRYFSLSDPSLADFLLSRLRQSAGERKALVEAVIHRQQLERFNEEYSELVVDHELQLGIRDRIVSGELGDSASTSLKMLMRYCGDVDVDSAMAHYLSELGNDGRFDRVYYESAHFVGDRKYSLQVSFKMIAASFETLVEYQLSRTSNRKVLKRLPSLFKKYGSDFQTFSEAPFTRQLLVEALNRVSETSFEDNIQERKDSFLDIDEIKQEYGDIMETRKALENILLPTFSLCSIPVKVYSFDSDYWQEVVEENQEAFESDSFEIDNFEYDVDEEDDDSADPIDNLFDGLVELGISEA